MRRWLRVLICLLLISCILVNLSPLRVNATSAGLVAPIVQAAGVSVSAPFAIAAMAISLGVMAGTNEDFQNLVSTAASSGLEWVKDGTVELLRTVDALGNQAFYVAGEFLESLRQGLFSSGAVSYSPGLTYAKECSFTGGGMTWELSCSKPVSIVCFNYYLTERNLERSKLYLVVPHTETSSSVDVSVYTPHDGNTKKVTLGFVNDYFRYSHLYTSYDGYLSSFSGMTIDLGSTTDLYISDSYMKNNPVFSASMSSPYDLTLGQISTVPIDGTSARSWAGDDVADRNGLYVKYNNDPEPPDDNNGKWFWRLALPLTAALLLAMSQADEWSGETPKEFDDYSTNTEFEILDRPEFDGYKGIELAPITNPNPNPNPGTNPDPDTGGDTDPTAPGEPDPGTDPDPDPDTNPDTDPDTDPDGGDGSHDGSGFWKPPSDHKVFALADLSKFFPFCIPFDLYDFFTLLNADPVAPVLSWEIKDLAGQTYSLDVDLSQWDSVAQLFRRLQLFLFITGLAAASRKFIKW